MASDGVGRERKVPRSSCLLLEDGSKYGGQAFGAGTLAHGEVVFNTSMTGYQEVLTDPSYAGQIVVLTYPLVGNYGINSGDFESPRIQVAGLVVREHCPYPSHAQSTSTLHEFLASQGIPALAGMDTRALTRRLRTRGVMMGYIYSQDPSEAHSGADSPYVEGSYSEAALARLGDLPKYGDVDFVRRVTTPDPFSWEGSSAGPDARGRIVVVDLGVKYNILRLLKARGWEAVAVPATSTAQEVMAHGPSGVVLSPGPGDPALLDYAVATARDLLGLVPVLGICLGHQIVARALGGSTFKLKYGHRGSNHPVRELATGRVRITAQNHGYAVDASSLPPDLEVTHLNLNDGTVEGLRHREMPVITVQYHSEASPGPRDNEYMFDRFLEMVEGWGNGQTT